MINSLVSFNKLAMENLSQNKLEMAYHFMHRAEKALTAMPESTEKGSLTLITCNNQACLYKALGQGQQASIFLHRAIEIHPSSTEDFFNLARCFLNLSLLKLEEKDFEASLKFSMQGLDLLTKNCDEDIEGYYENLGTAFNIIGNSQKSKGNDEEAFRAYKRGFDVCSKFLGNTHSVTQNLAKMLESKKYRFTKKPKSSEIVLPKMINRAWPNSVPIKKKEVSRRGSSFEYAPEYKPSRRKIIFTKETISEKPSFDYQPPLRKTIQNFEEKPKSSTKRQLKKDLSRFVLPIQSTFRAFLALVSLKQEQEVQNTKLTRRQLAEKKAILALQEFELLKVRAERENPY